MEISVDVDGAQGPDGFPMYDDGGANDVGEIVKFEGEVEFDGSRDKVRGGEANVVSESARSLVVRFVPNPGFVGDAGFSFTVDDDNGHQVAAPVSPWRCFPVAVH